MRVIVNVYDIQKSCNQKGADVFGVGIYHTGVEICGMEYAFGGNATLRTTGVYQMMPKSHGAFSFKSSIDMGEIPVDDFFKANKSRGPSRRTASNSARQDHISFDRDIWPILEELMDTYRANKYDMLLKNCNHFTDEFVRRLFGGKKSIANYINRAAYIGSFLHCLVPTKYITVIPPGCEEEAAALAEQWKLEEEMEAAKMKEQKKRSKEEMSTRETEMSMHQDGARASSGLKAAGGRKEKGGESGLIDSFYRSLTGRYRPESAAGEQNDGASAGTDSGDEDEPSQTNGARSRPIPSGAKILRIDGPDSDEDELEDSDPDTDAQMNQASDRAQLVAGNKKDADSEAPGSPNIRSSKKNSKGGKSRWPDPNEDADSPQQKSSRPQTYSQYVYQLVNPVGYFNYFFGSRSSSSQSGDS